MLDKAIGGLEVCFPFQTMTSVNFNGFSPYLVCALILWRSGSEKLMGEFYQLSASHMMVVGYYCFMFLFRMLSATILCFKG